mmetsp:Transcript_93419/g.301944  ORF Transcript_93419/g.301944 Transcript_93419/m.301944 type:complete len:367 (+) Transcript_93419:476-1576(+)
MGGLAREVGAEGLVGGSRGGPPLGRFLAAANVLGDWVLTAGRASAATGLRRNGPRYGSRQLWRPAPSRVGLGHGWVAAVHGCAHGLVVVHHHNLDVWHRRDARIPVAQEVAHGAGHVEPGVALAPDVDAVVPAAVEEHLAAGPLDAGPLRREVRLVVLREVLCPPIASAVLPLAQDSPAVANVRDEDRVRHEVVVDHSGCAAAPPGVNAVPGGCLLNKTLRCLEGSLQCMRGVGFQVSLRHQHLRELVFDVVGHIVAFAAVPIENAKDGVATLHPHNDKAILVGRLRLQTFLAGEADASVPRLLGPASDLDGFVAEACLAVPLLVGLGGDGGDAGLAPRNSAVLAAAPALELVDEHLQLPGVQLQE